MQTKHLHISAGNMAGIVEISEGPDLQQVHVVNSFCRCALHEQRAWQPSFIRRAFAIPHTSRLEVRNESNGVTVTRTQWYDEGTISILPHLNWDIRYWNLNTFVPFRKIGGQFLDEERILRGRARGYGSLLSYEYIRVIAK